MNRRAVKEKAFANKFNALIKNRDFKKLEEQILQPNLISILKLNRREEAHSNILAHLLDPSQQHGLKDSFLKLFLKAIFNKKKAPTARVKIYREWGRIDLLLEAPEFVVGIENKIDASERANQIKDYRALISRSFPGHKQKFKPNFIFLTPDGRKAKSSGDDGNVVLCSYRQISTILKNALKFKNISKYARSYMNNYRLTLERFIVEDGEMKNLAKKIYTEHREVLDFIMEQKSNERQSLTIEMEELVNSQYKYSLGSRTDGCVRFLPKSIAEKMPKSCKKKDWEKKEAFLFEIDFRNNSLRFDAVISPCDCKDKEKIKSALQDWAKDEENEVKPTGTEWIKYKLQEAPSCNLKDMKKVAIGMLDVQRKRVNAIARKIKAALR